ncbi:MAG: hypothetical protein ABIJ61_09655, partial [bacterium]
SAGFEIKGHPGIQDVKMQGFLGLEAPYDLLATATEVDPAASEMETSRHLFGAELATHIQYLIDIWRPRLALTLLDGLNESKLDSQTSYLLKARASLKLADFATAEQILAGMKANEPAVHYVKAICAHGQRQYIRALTYYEAAIDATNADTVNYLRAECRRESGERPKAAQLFREILKRDPGSLRAWAGLLCCAGSREALKAQAAEFLEVTKSSLTDSREAERLLEKLKPSGKVGSSTDLATKSRDSIGPATELKPRRPVHALDTDDPFMKLVPANAAPKDGGMRILLLADFNIAGQMTRIMRALNRYTNHVARCVILQDDYLSYDHDLLLNDSAGKPDSPAHQEAAALARQADFYHIGRQPFALPGIDWNRILNKNNTLFQYFGSYLRDNAAELRKLHQGRGFAAVTAMEWTMYRALPNGFYHIQPYMIEPDELPQVDWNAAGPIRICHAPSSANYRLLKGSDLIVKALQQLGDEFADLEIEIIENVSNADCLERKSKCHLHAVALRYGFGLNAVESAAQGLIPLVQLPNFVRMAYPDSPCVHVTAETLLDKTRRLLDNRDQLAQLGNACRDWGIREFAAENLIRKYWYLYDFIFNGLSVDYPPVWERIDQETVSAKTEAS